MTHNKPGEYFVMLEQQHKARLSKHEPEGNLDTVEFPNTLSDIGIADLNGILSSFTFDFACDGKSKSTGDQSVRLKQSRRAGIRRYEKPKKKTRYSVAKVTETTSGIVSEDHDVECDVEIDEKDSTDQLNDVLDESALVEGLVNDVNLISREPDLDRLVTDTKTAMVEHNREKALEAKKKLLNMALLALVQPDSEPSEEYFEVIANSDPEFILKLSLYTRHFLNIRTFSSHLLAYACNDQRCGIYLSKYFSAIITLPTDMLEVVELVLCRRQSAVSIPHRMRRVLKEKIIGFSDFHLAKYGKRYRGFLIQKEGIYLQAGITLKKLVSLLHMKEPKERIMKIMNVRYPRNIDEFYSFQMPGEFKPDKAGSRMSFDPIVTWERTLSCGGDKKQAWQYLIETDSIPYLALLRNLKKIMNAMVSDDHKSKALAKLQDERQVRKGRIFPLQYFKAASTMMNLDIEDLTGLENDTCPSGLQANIPQNDLIRVFQAINSAFETSLRFNLKPIPGYSVIIVGSHHIDSVDANYILSYALQTKCEYSDLFEVDIPEFQHFHRTSKDLRLSEVVRLENMWNLRVNDDKNEKRLHELWYRLLLKQPHRIIDNIITFSLSSNVDELVNYYRSKINPSLIHMSINESNFVSKCELDIGVNGTSDKILQFLDSNGEAGQLEYINRIDRIFKLNKEKERSTPSIDLMDDAKRFHNIPRWRNVRVFISSTFNDMHSERDVLTRFVFPELRQQFRRKGINLYDIDLRWGILASQRGSALQICLDEARRADIVVGIIGSRYGHQVHDYSDIQSLPGYEWLKDCEPGLSVTELEIRHAVLERMDVMQKRAFFYIRSDEFLGNTQKDKYGKYYFDSDVGARQKLAKFKADIVKSGAEVYVNYPCTFAGMTEGKVPVLIELEKFGQRVYDNVWNLIFNELSVEAGQSSADVSKNGISHPFDAHRELQWSIISEHASRFVGQEGLLASVVEFVKKASSESGLIGSHHDGGSFLATPIIMMLTGGSGFGKTALTCKLLVDWTTYFKRKTISVPIFCKHISTTGGRSMQHESSKEDGSSFDDVIVSYLRYEIRRQCTSAKVSRPTFTDCLSDPLKALRKDISDVAAMGYWVLVAIDDVEKIPFATLTSLLSCMRGSFVIMTATTGSVHEALLIEECTTTTGMHGNDDFRHLNLTSMPAVNRRMLAKAVLDSHRKTLGNAGFEAVQMRSLATKHHAGWPLYLSLACSHLLRNVTDWQLVTETIQALPDSMDGLVEERVAAVAKPTSKNTVDVAMMLSLLATDQQQYALSEPELIEMLWLHNNLVDADLSYNMSVHTIFKDMTTTMESSTSLSSHGIREFGSSVLSVVDGLSGLLNPRYQNDGAVVRLQHDAVKASVMAYLHSCHPNVISSDVKKLKAIYCWLQCDPRNSGSWTGVTDVYFISLIQALYEAGDMEVPEKLLSDVTFITRRCLFGHIDQLIHDYEHCIQARTSPELPSLTGATVSECYHFVKSCAHLLKRSPTDMMNIAYQLGHCSLIRSEIERNEKQVPIPITDQDRQAVISKSDVILPESSHIVSCSAVHSHKRLLALGLDDYTIAVYAIDSHCTMMCKLSGHSMATACLVFFDHPGYKGEVLLCSASHDKTVCFWNVTQGIRLKLSSNHKASVMAMTVVGDNELIVTGDCNAQLVCHNCRALSFVFTWTLENKQPIACVQTHPTDTLVIVSDWAGELTVYEPYNGVRRQTITLNVIVRQMVFDTLTSTSASVSGYVLSTQGSLHRIQFEDRGSPCLGPVTAVRDVRCMSLLPNAKSLLIGDGMGRVSLLEQSTPDTRSKVPYWSNVICASTTTNKLIVATTDLLVGIPLEHSARTDLPRTERIEKSCFFFFKNRACKLPACFNVTETTVMLLLKNSTNIECFLKENGQSIGSPCSIDCMNPEMMISREFSPNDDYFEMVTAMMTTNSDLLLYWNIISEMHSTYPNMSTISNDPKIESTETGTVTCFDLVEMNEDDPWCCLVVGNTAGAIVFLRRNRPLSDSTWCGACRYELKAHEDPVSDLVVDKKVSDCAFTVYTCSQSKWIQLSKFKLDHVFGSCQTTIRISVESTPLVMFVLDEDDYLYCFHEHCKCTCMEKHTLKKVWTQACTMKPSQLTFASKLTQISMYSDPASGLPTLQCVQNGEIFRHVFARLRVVDVDVSHSRQQLKNCSTVSVHSLATADTCETTSVQWISVHRDGRTVRHRHVGDSPTIPATVDVKMKGRTPIGADSLILSMDILSKDSRSPGIVQGCMLDQFGTVTTWEYNRFTKSCKLLDRFDSCIPAAKQTKIMSDLSLLAVIDNVGNVYYITRRGNHVELPKGESLPNPDERRGILCNSIYKKPSSIYVTVNDVADDYKKSVHGASVVRYTGDRKSIFKISGWPLRMLDAGENHCVYMDNDKDTIVFCTITRKTVQSGKEHHATTNRERRAVANKTDTGEGRDNKEASGEDHCSRASQRFQLSANGCEPVDNDQCVDYLATDYGELLVCGDISGQIHVFRFKDNNYMEPSKHIHTKPKRRPDGQTGVGKNSEIVRCIGISDERYVWTAASDFTVRLWSLSNLELLTYFWCSTLPSSIYCRQLLNGDNKDHQNDQNDDVAHCAVVMFENNTVKILQYGSASYLHSNVILPDS